MVALFLNLLYLLLNRGSYASAGSAWISYYILTYVDRFFSGIALPLVVIAVFSTTAVRAFFEASELSPIWAG